MNIKEIAEKHNFEIEAVEVKNHGTIIRGVGVKKLEAMRQDLLDGGHEKPISCHREHESAEAFMILWAY